MFEDLLGYASDVLGKPGRAVKSLLSGSTDDALAFLPFSDSLGITDKSNAVSGEDLFKKHFGPTGSETADSVLGFGVDMLTDPLNFVGLGMASKAARGASIAARTADESIQAARGLNATREALLAKGAMPAEVAAQTAVKDAAGNPLRTYHGSGRAFDEIDFRKFNDDSLYGPGYYTTANPEIASQYAKEFMGPEFHRPALESRRNIALKNLQTESNPKFIAMYEKELQGVEAELAAMGPRSENVRMQYLDMRNPFDIDKEIPRREARQILANAESPHPGEVLKTFDALHDADEWGHSPDVLGEDLYRLLHLTTGQKKLANEALMDAGYDGIIHTGGRNIGNVEHPVAIAFDPKQVYKPWVAPAERPIPAAYSGPSPLRAASPYLGALATEQTMAHGFRPPNPTEEYLRSLISGGR